MSELDTQELKYPSSDEKNYSDDTDSDQSFPDLTNLKAFDFEPTCAPREIQSSDEESENEVDKNRIGNVTWCRCESVSQWKRTLKAFAARTQTKSQKNYLKVY